MRRGACPTLGAPMLTGDGWLARFVARLTGAQAAGLAAAAGRLGNGRIDVTGRGSFQVRGLTPASAREFARVLDGLGIAVGDGRVMVGALAGLDAAEVEDPRGVAEGIRAGLAGRALGPKLSVVVDGGGALPLDGVAADVRVKALGGGVWEVAGVGRFDAAGAVAAALGALGRGRDRGREAAAPVGRFAVRGGVAVGMGVAFGQMEAAALAGLAAAVGDGEIRPAAGRGLIVRRRRGGGRGGGGAGVRGGPGRSAAGDRGLLRGAGLRGGAAGDARGGGGAGRAAGALRRGAGASLGVRQAVRAAGGGLRVAGGGGRDRGGRGGGAGGVGAWRRPGSGACRAGLPSRRWG